MKNECSIVRDLLPLSIENMVSEETAEFMKEHIKNCPGCRAEKEKLADALLNMINEQNSNIDNLNTLKKIRKSILKKEVLTAAVSVVIALSIVCGFGYYALYVGVPLEYHEVKIEKSFKEDITRTDGQILCGQALEISVRDTDGESVISRYKRSPIAEYSGYENGVYHEVEFRKPLFDLGHQPVTHAWSFSSYFDEPESTNEVIRFIFADETVEYSMQEEGLYVPQENLIPLPEEMHENIFRDR